MVSKWPVQQVNTLTEMRHVETRLRLTYVERESSHSCDHIKSARGFDFRNDISWSFLTQWPRFTQFSSRIGHFYHLGGHLRPLSLQRTWKLSCVNRRVSAGQEPRKVVELYSSETWTGFICSGQANPPSPSDSFGPTSLFSLTVPTFFYFHLLPPSSLFSFLPFLEKIVAPSTTTGEILAAPGELKDLLNHRSSTVFRPVLLIVQPACLLFSTPPSATLPPHRPCFALFSLHDREITSTELIITRLLRRNSCTGILFDGLWPSLFRRRCFQKFKEEASPLDSLAEEIPNWI